MAISPVGAPAAVSGALRIQSRSATPSATARAARRHDAAAVATQPSAITITSIVTRTNADGTVTTITTYADGFTAVTTEPPQDGVAGRQGAASAVNIQA